MIIRPPKFSELPVIVELTRKFVEESAYSAIPFDSEIMYFRIRHLLERFHDQEGGYVVLAQADNGEIHGGMLGTMNTYLFSDSHRYASDLGIFVLPEKRGSSAAYRMVKDFEEWSEKQGAFEICMGVSTGVNVERANAFYTKLGYNNLGGVYKKRLNPGGV